MTEVPTDIARLLRERRWAALGTLNAGAPLASMVAYAPEPGLAGLFMHLSGLSLHTRNLLADPRSSLVVTDPDTGTGDPQLLPRVGLTGSVVLLEPGSAEWREARGIYVGRFPDAEPRFDLGDFRLFFFVPEEARYVGGFAKARSYRWGT